jgi:tripartite-type tricarboxylate transporter receptor subunit TctC
VNFPTRPITLLTTHAAGSGVDIAARVIAPYLSKYVGQPIVVENRDGAGGRAARAELVKLKPDGYTLLTSGFPSMQLGELVFDGAYKTAELSYIYNFLGGGDYCNLYVAANSPYKTYADLVEAAKTKAVKVTIPGMGSSCHLLAVYLRMKAGLNSTVIQYPANATVLSVTSGDVPCAVDTTSGLVGQQGIRLLIQGSDTGRSSFFPDVPTTKELGFPGLGLPYLIGIVGPPGIPADISKVLENAMAKAVADPAFQADMKKGGMGVEGMDAAAFKAFNITWLAALQSVVADVKKDMQQ